MEIPNQLKKEEFRFILLNKNSKIAIEKEWQLSNNYKFNDPKLLKHLEDGGNYGILCGPGNLHILDIDERKTADEMFKILNVFTVKTCGGFYHFYFTSSYNINHTFDTGELRCHEQYVVGPNCYAVDKNKNHEGYYEIVKDIEIQEIPEEKVLKNLNTLLSTPKEKLEHHQIKVDKKFLDDNVLPLLGKFTRNLILNEYTIEGLKKQGFNSRSERDQKVITTLVLRGFGKYIVSVFELYPVGNKYREHSSGEKYLFHNIKEARIYSGVKDDSLFDLEEEIETIHPKVLRNKIDDYLNKINKLENWIFQQYLINTIAHRIIISKKDLLKRLEEIKTMHLIRNTTSVFDLIDKQFPDVDYWVKPIIPKNTLILIGGKPGTFKSMFVFSLALTTQLSNVFLDTFVIKEKPKILLYDLENGEKILWWRLKYLCNGKNLEKENLKNFHIEYSFDKINMERELELAMKYDIIILDSYRRFLKGAENESDITDKFFREFLSKLRDAGKTIIILHHFKKGNLEEIDDEDIMDMFRGSSDIPAQFDLVLGMFKSKELVNSEDATTRFKVNLLKVKNRLGLPFKNFNFDVEKDDINKKTTFVFRDFKSYTTPKNLIADRLLELLQSRNIMTRAEIVNVLRKEIDISEISIFKYLKELVKEGTINQPKFGVYSSIDFCFEEKTSHNYQTKI